MDKEHPYAVTRYRLTRVMHREFATQKEANDFFNRIKEKGLPPTEQRILLALIRGPRTADEYSNIVVRTATDPPLWQI